MPKSKSIHNDSSANAVTVEIWRKEAVKLFGEDPKHWRFQCPICANVQTAADWIAEGLDPNLVCQECVGRHRPGSYKALGHNQPGTPRSPCDYAAYGLFGIGTRSVIPEGSDKPARVFPFAEPAGGAPTPET